MLHGKILIKLKYAHSMINVLYKICEYCKTILAHNKIQIKYIERLPEYIHFKLWTRKKKEEKKKAVT